jgi:hypothetical protein
MKEDSLRQRLNELRVPPALESARSRARHRALIAFQQDRAAQPDLAETRGFAWKWLGLVALIVLAALLPIFQVRPRTTPENVAGDRQMLRQMEKLFPQQLDSVVEENGKIDLSVAPTAMVGADQPIVVVFRKDGQSIRVLSYSGHHVCVSLGQEHRCFDLLATPSGGVILEDGDRLLTAQGHSVVAGYSVQAQTLEASL